MLRRKPKQISWKLHPKHWNELHGFYEEDQVRCYDSGGGITYMPIPKHWILTGQVVTKPRAISTVKVKR